MQAERCCPHLWAHPFLLAAREKTKFPHSAASAVTPTKLTDL
jgi:hypothetical protein